MIYYGFDFLYVVIVLPMLILSMIAQYKVKTTYHKYSKQMSCRGFRAEDAVRRILDSRGLTHVQITRVAGELTDHFDPRNNVIALSESVYGSTSVAAIGVAAHEAGHAIQHAEGYVPNKVRTAIVPVTQLGSKLSMPLVILGLILGVYPLAYAGILLFGTVALFQLITLPTEFNASRRAMAAIEEGHYLTDDELKGTRKVLTAAASTYVAALFVSLASLLRLILIVNGRRRD